MQSALTAAVLLFLLLSQQPLHTDATNAIMDKFSAEVVQHHHGSRTRAFRNPTSAPPSAAGAGFLKGCAETYPISPVWDGRNFSSSNCVYDPDLQDSDMKRCLTNSRVHIWGNSIARHFAFHLAHALQGAGGNAEEQQQPHKADRVHSREEEKSLCSKMPGLLGKGLTPSCSFHVPGNISIYNSWLLDFDKFAGPAQANRQAPVKVRCQRGGPAFTAFPVPCVLYPHPSPPPPSHLVPLQEREKDVCSALDSEEQCLLQLGLPNSSEQDVLLFNMGIGFSLWDPMPTDARDGIKQWRQQRVESFISKVRLLLGGCISTDTHTHTHTCPVHSPRMSPAR